VSAVIGFDESGQSAFWHCPGCECAHRVYVKSGSEKGPVWKWNGNTEKPTFEPSVLVRGTIRCHCYVREGAIQFLDDCEHKLAGQTVPMMEW